MIRLPGILKVSAVLLADFLAVFTVFNNESIALMLTGAVGLYVWLGGYLSLFKDGAVRWDRLPSYESMRLTNAKLQLTEDVKRASSVDISKLKLYLIPEDYDYQAMAYGANCISVSAGTFNNSDPLTLNAVLGHEISHILNYDAEFNRAVLATVFLLAGAITMASYALAAVIFIVFLVCDCLKSWSDVMAYRGTRKVFDGLFGFLKAMIVMICMTVLNFLNRSVEYRCDRYSASLDRSYGLQLANFLSHIAAAGDAADRQVSLTEVLYRSHPPTLKRVARLEAYVMDNEKALSKH